MPKGAHTAEAGAPIASLPSSTQSQLRSTQILTSLPQLISELVQNSLDAGAHNIDVAVDPEEWECSVRDDGAGIPRDGLDILAKGSQDGRYGTSKAYTPASLDEVTTFGFRGEALASAADIACLEVSSRTAHSRECWSVILKGGQTLYAGPSVRWRRESAGTVISIRDAFYNLPIRRRSHPNATRTIELVKRELESFALVFPGVSFSLENTRRDKEGTAARSKTRVLTVPKTASTLAAFRHLYGKALADDVEEIHEECDDMRLEGFVSLQGAYSKAYQFLYINKHPMATCDLHRQIDGIYSRSSFGKHALDELGKSNYTTAAVRRSPRKAEKRAVYVLNLTIPPRFVDNCVEPAKAAVQLQNSSAATAFLSSVIERVLVKHRYLIPRVDRAHPSNVSVTPRKRPRYDRENDPSGSAHRARSLHAPSHPSPGTMRRPSSSGLCSAPNHPAEPFPIIQGNSAVVGGVGEVADVIWTDPATGERFVIDGRTGNSYPQVAPAAPSLADTSAAPAVRPRMTLGTRQTLSAPGDTPAWIAEALEANEAYRLSERKINALPSCAELVERHTCNAGSTHGRPASVHTNAAWDAPRLGRLAASDLRTARVLGQVDRKFIACVVRASQSHAGEREAGGEASGLRGGEGSGEGALVLIDQHAADERVRVERFLRELCAPPCEAEAHGRCGEWGSVGVRARALVPPKNVLLTRAEVRAIAETPDVRSGFARWGITFAALPPGQDELTGHPGQDEAAYAQVAVTAVPEVVADKLLLGDELRDLIKGYLARLQTDGLEGSMQDIALSEGGGDAHGWQRALRHCPRELVDLVNSKACRGAIMFNDTLTLEQCKNLLEKLSRTSLPFQCAHGRPSLVPLVEVSGVASDRLDNAIDWGEFMR